MSSKSSIILSFNVSYFRRGGEREREVEDKQSSVPDRLIKVVLCPAHVFFSSPLLYCQNVSTLIIVLVY